MAGVHALERIRAQLGGAVELHLVDERDVHARVDRDTSGAAHRVRAEHRQDHIGPGVHAPVAQRLAEILVLSLQSHTRGRIEQADQADGAVDQEAAGGGRRLLAPELQQAVVQGADFTDIAEEVAHAGAHEAGGDGLVGIDHRQEDELVQAIVEGVHAPVEPLPRVVHVGDDLVVELGQGVHRRFLIRPQGRSGGAADELGEQHQDDEQEPGAKWCGGHCPCPPFFPESLRKVTMSAMFCRYSKLPRWPPRG